MGKFGLKLSYDRSKVVPAMSIHDNQLRNGLT